MQALLSDDCDNQRFFNTERDLKRFQAIYADTAFVCRSLSCLRHSQGFATEQERDVHERQHQPRLFCSELSCAFATGVGFRTAAQLKAHGRKYHSAGQGVPHFGGQTSHTDSFYEEQRFQTILDGLRSRDLSFLTGWRGKMLLSTRATNVMHL